MYVRFASGLLDFQEAPCSGLPNQLNYWAQIRRDFPPTGHICPILLVFHAQRFGRTFERPSDTNLANSHPYTATDFVDSKFGQLRIEQPKRRFLAVLAAWHPFLQPYIHLGHNNIFPFGRKNVIMSQVIVKCLPNGHSTVTRWPLQWPLAGLMIWGYVINLFLLHYIRKMRPQLSPVEVAGPWRLLGRAESGQRRWETTLSIYGNNQMV